MNQITFSPELSVPLRWLDHSLPFYLDTSQKQCSIEYILGSPVRKKYYIISKYSKHTLPSLIAVQIA